MTPGRLSLLGGVIVIACGVCSPVRAQAGPGGPGAPGPFPLENLFPGLRGRAVVMDIAARILERDEQVWGVENTRVTIPGQPVGLRLVGTNLVVTAQFTPYFRPDGSSFLVAQGQIWINLPEQGISYFTIMQSIPLVFGEQIYFFPLGAEAGGMVGDAAWIEIQLVLRPYEDQGAAGEHEDQG